jgi:rfaE bifunctional protein nucleotidyltransferase chain/domain
MKTQKILAFKTLIQQVIELKSAGKKIVYAQGFFDLLHIGHVYHLQRAKKLGDILIVGVNSDRFFKKRQGKTLFKEDERMKFVADLDCVDFVVLNDAPDAIETLRKIKPNIYAKGEDVKEKAANPAENLYKEIKALEAVGGKIYFTKSLPIHSTELLAKLLKEQLKEKNGN